MQPLFFIIQNTERKFNTKIIQGRQPCKAKFIQAFSKQNFKASPSVIEQVFVNKYFSTSCHQIRSHGGLFYIKEFVSNCLEMETEGSQASYDMSLGKT